MKKKLYFIKFGGSLITDKRIPYKRRDEIIQRCVDDFAVVRKKEKDALFILGNGAGSFGHYAAIKNDIQKPLGFALVQQKVKELNAYIVGKILDSDIAAMSIHQSSILTASGGKLKNIYLDSLLGSLDANITPVLYGDIVYDDKKKSHIFSTEEIFDVLIHKLSDHFSIEKVIFETTVDGFLDTDKKVVKSITNNSWDALKGNVLKTEGFDVTGGMEHKVLKALEYSKKGITTHIVSGLQERVLERLILGSEDIGTKIS